MTWYNEQAPKCKSCRKVSQLDDPNGQPDCENCRVVLMPENEDVARVYMATRRQVIIGGNRVIDINIMAIKTMMDLYEVKNQAECMERVRGLFYYFAGKK